MGGPFQSGRARWKRRGKSVQAGSKQWNGAPFAVLVKSGIQSSWLVAGSTRMVWPYAPPVGKNEILSLCEAAQHALNRKQNEPSYG